LPSVPSFKGLPRNCLTIEKLISYSLNNISLNVLLTGYDGYEGFPLAIRLLKEGHCVFGIDNYFRREWVKQIGSISAIPIKGGSIRTEQLKKLGPFQGFAIALTDDLNLNEIFKQNRIDVVIHSAAQPSAPYSMKWKNFTLDNNFETTLRLAEHLTYYNPQGHFIFISTMGEYGTPDMEIPEGFGLDNNENPLPFSRDPGSWYHLSKVMCTQALYLHHKITDLKISIAMQGVVYGTRTKDMDKDHTTRFDFDKYFGTVLNRFVAQTIIKKRMTVYGSGNQKRGFLFLGDAVDAIINLMEKTEKRFTIENHNSLFASILDLSFEVQEQGNKVLKYENQIEHVKNTRIEKDYAHFEVEGMILDPFKRDFSKNIFEMFNELIKYKETILKYKDSI